MWQVESQTITQGGAVAFLIIASGSLLLLYFFLDKAFYVILVSSKSEFSSSPTRLSRYCHIEVPATQSGVVLKYVCVCCCLPTGVSIVHELLR